MTGGKLALACLSGLMLGFSFPPIPFGSLACVALVPLLLLLDQVESYSKALRYAYLTFFIFNLVTLYWVGGFTQGHDVFLMLAGAALVIGHPLFFLVPIIAYLFVKKELGLSVALLTLPFLWVGFEWLHSLGEVGFPWLTLGNTQTYALERIQYITYTGVYGITFWIVALNAIIYYVYTKIIQNEWRIVSAQSASAAVLFILIFLLPGIHGKIVLSSPSSVVHLDRIRVGILQPNIDPWKKWEAEPDTQIRHYLQLTRDLGKEKPELIIWPETAISFRILSGRYSDLFRELKREVDILGTALLTGFPDVVFYDGSNARSGSKTLEGMSTRYEDFNAIMMIVPKKEKIQKYAKIKLVPFAERVPYAEKLSFLAQTIRWDVGITGWGIGRDTTVFQLDRGDSTTNFSAMVCYESIYPDLVSRFVRKGAQFLVIVTNDSWWGKTSGAYQHAQYAILRAIENRRSIARCANGGISCFIDSYGKITDARDLYTRASLVGEVRLSDERTFYSMHGDLFSQVCTGVGLLAILGAALGKLSKTSRRKT